MVTAILKMDNQQGRTIAHGTYLMLLTCGSLNGRGGWRRIDACV